ncbi:hypothetical protein AKJ57_04665 [candidate division MSBL1 archaeon SCGC-AAA259A05]|uniref:Uncharacterized protein n=1 Tax=candidate division MSBL1 archaeon SCGC-AAA259A05 TaxID=1698259 RepID=A0A133U722_9EURY|nr:hypothetical protein AKJ57_04665 [candidate division MSBL1 archaeon SCGC-AAA259A05]
MIDSFSQVSSEEMLQLAEERIFSLGPRDLASALSYQNMRYGLGKVIYALEGDVYCVFGPDATITRNKGRWTSSRTDTTGKILKPETVQLRKKAKNNPNQLKKENRRWVGLIQRGRKP